MAGYALGFDVGSSSIKASLVDIDSRRCVATVHAPAQEMPITAGRPDWAEQDPRMWWRYIVECTQLLRREWSLDQVASVGISYQMHGLVAVDSSGNPLRDAIIWCDSRAVTYGEQALAALGGAEVVLPRLLNSPGNFTASKLAWVQEHEPELYKQIQYIMLPGDWLAYRMTGTAATTMGGLSEGILWDFSLGEPAQIVLDHFQFDPALIPPVRENIAKPDDPHGLVTSKVAEELGIPAGTPVSYRAGDQPNNALSLNVLQPGEVAATAGTSGVIYGVVDRPVWDPASRVNTFLHVNHTPAVPRLGVLQIVNGTGILNRWMREEITSRDISYQEMNTIATTIPVGSDGLTMLPFGNGAERILNNANPGGSVHGLNFNIHRRAHLLRAAQEGIVFALNRGLGIMRDMGLAVHTVRAGQGNMFLSTLFQEAFATVTEATVELYNTDGSEGAARGGAYGAGLFSSLPEAFSGLTVQKRIEPNTAHAAAYQEAYQRWSAILERTVPVP
jgi:xylulokinase